MIDHLRALFLFWVLKMIHCLSWNKSMLFDVSHVMYRINKKQITAVKKNLPLAVPFALLGQLSRKFGTA